MPKRNKEGERLLAQLSRSGSAVSREVAGSEHESQRPPSGLFLSAVAP